MQAPRAAQPVHEEQCRFVAGTATAAASPRKHRVEEEHLTQRDLLRCAWIIGRVFRRAGKGLKPRAVRGHRARYHQQDNPRQAHSDSKFTTGVQAASAVNVRKQDNRRHVLFSDFEPDSCPRR